MILKRILIYLQNRNSGNTFLKPGGVIPVPEIMAFLEAPGLSLHSYI
jgi:hypothetical protein